MGEPVLVQAKRILLLGFVATLVVGAVPLTAPGVAAVSSATGVATGQRDALLKQLESADPQIAAAERSLTSVQAQLASSSSALAADNTRLVEVQSQMSNNQQVLARAKQGLAQMLRVTYVSGGQNTVTGAVFASDNFNQAFDRLRGAQTVSDQLGVLLHAVDQTQTALAQEQKLLTQQKAVSLKLESGLAAQSSQLLATVAARDQLLANATPAVVAIVAKIDNSANTGSPRPTGRSAPRVMAYAGGSSCSNHFAYGQCTWYVASRRCIPWFGNASQWLGAAAAAGYATGRTPAVGAVAVWYPGQGGAGGSGHVAYVEAVGNGTYTVSEMNWNGGWAHTSSRTLADSSPIGGFIYG